MTATKTVDKVLSEHREAVARLTERTLRKLRKLGVDKREPVR